MGRNPVRQANKPKTNTRLPIGVAKKVPTALRIKYLEAIAQEYMSFKIQEDESYRKASRDEHSLALRATSKPLYASLIAGHKKKIRDLAGQYPSPEPEDEEDDDNERDEASKGNGDDDGSDTSSCSDFEFDKLDDESDKADAKSKTDDTDDEETESEDDHDEKDDGRDVNKQRDEQSGESNSGDSPSSRQQELKYENYRHLDDDEID